MGAGALTNVRVACAPFGVYAGGLVTVAGLLRLADGFRGAAGFAGPFDVAVDASDNVYVADAGGVSAIRKISPAGMVTTLAGGRSHCGGGSNGVGRDAIFCDPSGIAFDAASGNLYIGDTSWSDVRKVTLAGVVTTAAGGSGRGWVDGQGSSSLFQSPQRLKTDGAGNVYIPDTSNHRIRKMSSDGNVTTIAGSGAAAYADGAGLAASFNAPEGVAVDATGNVYVADTNNHRIRKVTAGGKVTTLAGSGVGEFADGSGASAGFSYPRGLAIDASGTLFVADGNNHRIRKVTPSGVVTTLAGGDAGFADGTGPDAKFRTPSGVALDRTGNVYVADSDNRVIRKITPSGVVTTIAGNPFRSRDGKAAEAILNGPANVLADATGNLLVPEWGGDMIRNVAVDGTVTTFAGAIGAGFEDGPLSTARFDTPKVIVRDGSGTLYVTDALNRRIRQISAAGIVTTLAGSTPGLSDGNGASAQFEYPNGLALDQGLGVMYVADEGNHRIRQVTKGGTVTTFAGSGSGGYADGPPLAAKFSYPRGVTLDSAGNIYVADADNCRIRKIAAGLVSTLVGQSQCGNRDGTSATALLDNLTAISRDPSDTIYVTDSHSVRRVTQTGTVLNLVGPELGSIADNASSAAYFREVGGIDASTGTIYVSDQGAGVVYRLLPEGSGKLVANWVKLGGSDGSSLIQTYTGTATAPGQTTRTCSVSNGASTCTIAGLTPGVKYTVSVTLTDSTGATSPASSSVEAKAW